MTNTEWEALTLEEKHKLDLEIPCLECHAAEGNECIGLSHGIVHFSRRVKRVALLLRPELVDPFS